MTLYVPCRTDEEMLYNMLRSVQGQVNDVVVINNTGHTLDIPKDIRNMVMVIDPPDQLLYGQSLNVAIKHAAKAGYKYCLWAHSDIRLQPNAIYTLMKYYETIKDTKWGQVLTNYDSLCLFNPDFFIKEDIWDDVILFPQYFGDNHRHRLMELRGYNIYTCDEAAKLVHHIGSHTIKNHNEYWKRNEYAFKYDSMLYAELWGGNPHQETVTDPTCHGIYPVR